MSHTETAAHASGGARWKVPAMRPRMRKTVLALHVISSVSWLGLSIGYLTLAITAVLTDSPEQQHAMLRTIGVLGDRLLLPISWIALLTGVWISLGTHWGLFRHTWVLVKFVLTLVAVVLIPSSLLPGIHQAVAAVEHTATGQFTDIGFASTRALLAAGCVSSSMYITCVVLSVFKPWGRTRFGKRRRHTADVVDRPASR